MICSMNEKSKVKSSSISIPIKIIKSSISFLLIHSFSHNLSHKKSSNKNEINSWNIFNAMCVICYAYNIKLFFLLKIFNVYVRYFIALWFHYEFLTNIEKKLKKINS